MTKIAFRMDDICPTMDRDRFVAIRDLFIKYNIKPLLGIIPDNRDPNLMVAKSNPLFWDEVCRLVNHFSWAVAQHGYQHKCESNDGGMLRINQMSEFATLPYHVQKEKISNGKKRLLEYGMKTETWMAPAHSYDINTLRALCDLGFKIVTDGYSFLPYHYMDLKFIPCQFGVPRKPPFGIATICIHSNELDSAYYKRIESFVDRNRDKIVDFKDLCSVPTNNFTQQIIEPIFLMLRQIKNATTKS